MKKTLLAFTFLLAIVAKADYLYWMVDNPADDISWDSAAIYQGDTQLGPTVAAADMQLFGYSQATLLEGYDAATYFIELYQEGNSNPVAKAKLSYNDIKSGIFGDNPIGGPGSSVFAPGAGTFNVPEPTSGLLFLVGGMLLGLRRKRRV